MYSLYNLQRKNDQREFLDPDVSVDVFPPSDQRLVRSGGGWKFRGVANVQGELGVFSMFFLGGEWLLLRGIDPHQTGVGDSIFRLVNFGNSKFMVSSNLIAKLVHLIWSNSSELTTSFWAPKMVLV